MIPFTQDLGVFFATIYGGIFIGVLFDIYRACKKNFNIIKIFSLFYDIIFWIIVTGLVFVTINVIESFDLRYYHFIALFLGFIIYYNTVSVLTLKVLNLIIGYIIKIFNKGISCMCNISVNLYYVIIYSIHLLFDTMFYIPNLIFRLFRILSFKISKVKRVNHRG